jgi:hypothetical protein
VILEQSGEVTVAGVTFPVYQCERCTIKTEMFGEPVEVAVTFAVDQQGRSSWPQWVQGKDFPFMQGSIAHEPRRS